MRHRPLTQFLQQRLTLLLIPLTAFLLAGTPAFAAPMLTFNGMNQLTGATGVDVGGTLYDVTLMDGTCVDLFSRCDSLSDFPFPGAQAFAPANAAFRALLNTPQFAYDGTNVIGCASPTRCVITTPETFSSISHVGVRAVNWRGTWLDAGGAIARNADLTDDDILVYGKWTVSTPVPEPTTLLLLSTGLVGLVGYRWRQGRREGQQVG